MKVRVLYHDHCFDGAASAAYITRFLRSKFYPGAQFEYTGLAHRADQLFEDTLFDGDANVIVDFKYATHPNLTWWFDHHQSAFLSTARQNISIGILPAASCSIRAIALARSSFPQW